MISQAVPALLVGFLLWLCSLMLGPLLSRSRVYSTKFIHEVHGEPQRRRFAFSSLRARAPASSIKHSRIRYCDVLKTWVHHRALRVPGGLACQDRAPPGGHAFRQGFTGGYVDAGNATVSRRRRKALKALD